MILYSEALRLILERASSLPVEKIPLERSLHAYLAKDIKASFDIPRFDQSAVDGFAVRTEETTGASADSPAAVRLVGEIAAGSGLIPRVRPGTAAKIFTGGRMPPGADAAVMKEVCRITGDSVLIEKPVRTGENVRYKGEEYKKGAPVLTRGTRITPPVIGLLATFGLAEVSVHRKPRVTILSTGDEIVPPGNKLEPGQIYDSNSYALTAALRSLGIEQVRVQRVPDRKPNLDRALAKALDSSDVLITVGGVSVGDRDLVKAGFAEHGVEQVYWRVAIKPGLPNYFGVAKGKGTTLVFGVPGNPVAALLSFHKLIRPALVQLMGGTHHPPIPITATLQEPISKAASRSEWVRGVLRSEDEKLLVTPFAGQGSHMLGGLARANCLIDFPLGATHIEAGQPVTVEFLDWEE